MATKTGNRRKPGRGDNWTTGEIARGLGVSCRTVDSWIAKGRIAYWTLPSGQKRVPTYELRQFLSSIGVRTADFLVAVGALTRDEAGW